MIMISGTIDLNPSAKTKVVGDDERRRSTPLLWGSNKTGNAKTLQQRKIGNATRFVKKKFHIL